MKRMSTFRAVGACVGALVLACCGCSKRNQLEPLVTKDAEFALGVNLNKKQAFTVIDAYADLVLELLAFDGEDAKKVKEKIAVCRKELFRDAPEGVRGFLDESGLEDADLRWAVLSMDNIKFEDGKPRLDGLSLAVAGNVDVGKLVSAIQKKSEEFAGHALIFAETTIEGERTWHCEPKEKDGKVARAMRDLYADPYVTSLGDQLLLVAMSRGPLEKQIRLYRKKTGKGDALSGFSAADGELMRLHVSGVGGLARKNMSRRELEALRIPEEIILGLKDMDVNVKVASDGRLMDSLRLGAASEKDADSLRALVKTGLMLATDQLAKEGVQNVKKLFADVTVGGKDAEFEILQGHGVLLGALGRTSSCVAITNTMPPLACLNLTKLAAQFCRDDSLVEAEKCILKATDLLEDTDLRIQLVLARVQIAKEDFVQARATLRKLASRRNELSESDRAVFDGLQQKVLKQGKGK